MKSVRIQSFSGPYFPALKLNTERYGVLVRMRENTDQKNSEYGHFSRSKLAHLFFSYFAMILGSKKCQNLMKADFFAKVLVNPILDNKRSIR